VTTRRALGLAVALAAAAAASARAQNAAHTRAVGVVAAEPPTLAAVEDLRFGPFLRGTAVSVDPRSSLSAAKFEIHGAGQVEFTLMFALPTALRAADGEHVLPVRFGPADACHAERDQQSACAPFDPSGALINRRPPPDGSHYIWLGGRIDPDPSQAPGEYTGTITATMHYTSI
jgi:hypothetical protein